MPTCSRLTRQQRYTIETMLRKGHTQKSIEGAVGVDPSSVSRELKRGEMNLASYCYVAVQRDADNRDWKGVRINPELWKCVEEKLRE
ncbi:MAG: helix-turn-helix domain-containing protein [Proteobacteria bacterium]|nr:MAG: helix-turn-helix domain-containing protein [Pseudomonadota bacterium]